VNEQEATGLVDATPEAVRAVLLDVLAMPAWNPAFLDISGPPTAQVGVDYAIRVRPVFTGTLRYDAIEPGRIDMSWRVPGFHETGSWHLEPAGQGTIVRHSFSHRGPLARALSSAYRGVATLRITRLASRTT
jgi:hypothetical protein